MSGGRRSYSCSCTVLCACRRRAVACGAGGVRVSRCFDYYTFSAPRVRVQLQECGNGAGGKTTNINAQWENNTQSQASSERSEPTVCKAVHRYTLCCRSEPKAKAEAAITTCLCLSLLLYVKNALLWRGNPRRDQGHTGISMYCRTAPALQVTPYQVTLCASGSYLVIPFMNIAQSHRARSHRRTTTRAADAQSRARVPGNIWWPVRCGCTPVTTDIIPSRRAVVHPSIRSICPSSTAPWHPLLP